MTSEPIQFFNRYSGRIETEQVYGNSYLQWTYGNPLGKLSLHGLVKRSAFSQWYGKRMDHPDSRKKVMPFIKKYAVNTGEFSDSTDNYATFNEFFYRKLKAGARPIFPGRQVAVFPADGRHLAIQDISKATGIFVKGQMFSVEKLVQDSELAKKYGNGSMIISRLCPVDYHRFHFPVSGQAGEIHRISGPLFSVNPIALRQNIHIFTENKRAYCRIKSEEFGEVLMFEIGATCVGRFEYTYKPGAVGKGEEKGFFKFGGSSTLLLFEPRRIRLDTDLLQNSAEQRELYARMGDRMGQCL